MPNSVKVPKEFEPIFEKAQEYVSKYFKEKIEDPSKGTIEIFGERYILIRAASMSVDFFETVKNLYRDEGDEEALNVARSLLFDIAHAIGKTDAKNFHKKMDLKSPIEKLSAGPIHFSHSGWAFVDIFPESRPSPDENYFLIYDHPFSFESDAWMKAGRRSDFPVCVMNAGYSSGWCEESFGISLVASEIMCRAKGDEVCRFIMAHPSKIEDYIKEYLKKEPELAKKVTKYEIPGFFKRKHIEEALRRAYDELEKRVEERTKELQQEVDYRRRVEERILGQSVVLEAINRVFRETLRSENEEEVARTCLAVAEELTGSKFGFIGEVNQVGRIDLIAMSDPGWSACRIPRSDAVVGLKNMEIRGIWGRVFKEEQSLIVNDPASHPDRIGIPEGHPLLTSFLGVPLKRAGRTIGMIALANKESGYNLADQQNVETLSVAFVEVLNRKQAEETLRQSENKYRTLVENLPQKIFLKDKNDVYISSNENYASDLKISPDEITGKTDYEFFPTELAEKYRADDRRIMESGKTEDLEERYVQDGREVWVHTVKIPVKDKKGQCVGLLGVFWDVTERKRAEEKLRESEERYRDLFDNASDLIQSVDERGKFVYVNKKWKEVMGYSDEEIKKLHLTDVLRKDQVPHCMELLKKVAHGETLDNVEVVFVTKGGKEIFASGFVNPKIKDGKFVATRAIFRDITERKRAEENLLKAKEEAEEANRLKSEFLANMSHEIRTPMNAIIGMTGITLDTELTNEQREYLSIVKESGYALLGLLDDILDLSKIEAGQMGLDVIDFDLRTTIEGVTDTLAARASSKGLELACMIHPQVPTLLRGDPGRLRQILMNLGGNAVKFTEKGEVVIGVELSEETKDRVRLLFSVTDTGIGIPKDKQEKVFESFVQADGSATRKYGGTGLGLSISRRLVKLLGGQIGVESQPDRGSRFWFTVTFEKQKEFKEISLTLPPDIGGLRMLVVDDNQTNRVILLKMLESFGCYAEAVESGTKALQILKRAVHKEKLFDLVLLDMQMPQMDGEQTLRAIKADPELEDVLVIILTSIGIRGDVARLEALGCAGYLTKPIKQSQLFDAIITIWSQQKTVAKEKTLGSMGPSTIVTRHTIEEQKRQRVHILLAEDNPMNQKLAATLLKKAGYSVDAVEDGRQVIEAVKRRAYDLILMDVQMPEMNGFEATQAIREMEGEAKHTPIIAMTAHAMKGDRERCLQAGMDDYISKPIEPQELFHAIDKWTKSHDSEKDLTPFTLHLSPLKEEKDIPTGSEIVETTCGEPVEPIDLESALRRFDGDKDFFKEMLQEFLSYAPKQLEKLAEAIKTGEAKVVEREAHSLKGAADNLGVKPIADIALRLEVLGRTGDLAGAEEIVSNLRTAFEHLEEYIDKSLPREGALRS
jgi:two-component system sensor histidine kinase/response regulator